MGGKRNRLGGQIGLSEAKSNDTKAKEEPSWPNWAQAGLSSGQVGPRWSKLGPTCVGKLDKIADNGSRKGSLKYSATPRNFLVTCPVVLVDLKDLTE